MVVHKEGDKPPTTKRNKKPADGTTGDTWRTFFAESKKLSSRKKRKLSAARNQKKREEEEAKEMDIQKWLELYKNRLKSDENWDEYCLTPVPPGAWGRVD